MASDDLAPRGDENVPAREGLVKWIDSLSEEQQGELLRAIQDPSSPGLETSILAAFYSGPLPLPAHYDQYERTQKGSANSILRMAEKEQQIKADSIARGNPMNGWLSAEPSCWASHRRCWGE